MISNTEIQTKIDAMRPGTYELRVIFGIPSTAACPGPLGIRLSKNISLFSGIVRAQGVGPNGSNLYEIL